MGMLSDIFAAVRLQLDGTGFEAQATALANKQGQNVGTLMSDQLNAKIKKAVMGTAGALAGLGLASAISGAETLNKLAGDYQMQTGANAEETKAFTGTLNDLFKTSHQGYDEIAQTLIGIKTHFDLAGDAAKGLATNVLDFAEIAGGTGSDAVERLNSLVKTGVIGEADMSATMDKLVLAHQQWGININETIDSLVKFAPAMSALNMSGDEAIAWMSIFNKAGIDAQRVTMGFNTAIKKVRTPEEFKALVATIASTPDDFKRAQLASDLFGQRAGSALANMLRPGAQSVSDMAALIGSNYTGSVAKAAAANDATFGGQALLILHKFQGALTDVATSMGTSSDAILTAFALLGPGLTKGVLSAAGGLGSLLLPKLLATMAATEVQMTAAGYAQGLAAGGGEVAGEVTAIKAGTPEVVAAVGSSSGAVAAAAGTVGAAAGGSLVGGITGALSAVGFILAVGSAVQKGFDWIVNTLGGPQLDRLQALQDQAAAQAAAQAADAASRAAHAGDLAGQMASHGVVAGLTAGESAVASAARNNLQKPIVMAGNGARQMMIDILQGIVDDAKAKFTELTTLGNDLVDALYGPQERAAKLNKLQKDAAAAQDIATAGKMTDAEKHQLDVRILNEQDHIRTLKKMHASANAIADAEEKLAHDKAIQRSKDVTAKQIADAKARLINDQKEGLALRIEMAGRGELSDAAYSKLVADLSKMATTGSAEVRAAAQLALDTLAKLKAAATSAGVPGNWGTGSFRGGNTGAHPTAAGGRRAAGELLLVGEQGPEFWVPDSAGVVIPNDRLTIRPQGDGSDGSGGGNTTVNLTVQGLVEATNPLEIASQARRFARLGLLARPKRLRRGSR